MAALAPGGIKLIAIASVFQFLAIVAITLRIWARRLNRRKLDASDWLVIVSLMITSLLTAIIFAGVVIGGAGKHQSAVTSASGTEALDKAAKIVFIAELMWLATNALTKLSTLAFYTSIFRVSRFRYVIYATMGLTVACTIAFIVKDFLICRPVSRNWTFEGDNFCGITTGGTILTGVGVTVVDVLIVILPMPMLLKLQMPLMKRIMICGIFSLGLVVCIVSGLRLASVLDLDYKDLTYTIVPLGIFTLLEPLLAIIATCLPTLHPVLTRFCKSELFDWTRRGSRKGSASGKRSLGTGGSTTLQGTGNDTRNFNRLYDHLYPITTTTVTETLTEEERDVTWSKGVGGPFAYRKHELQQQQEDEVKGHELQPWSSPRSGISVTKEFQIRSMRISDEDVLSRLQTVQEEADLESGTGQAAYHQQLNQQYLQFYEQQQRQQQRSSSRTRRDETDAKAPNSPLSPHAL